MWAIRLKCMNEFRNPNDRFKGRLESAHYGSSHLNDRCIVVEMAIFPQRAPHKLKSRNYWRGHRRREKKTVGESTYILAGGFKYFLFSPLPVEMIQFDYCNIFQMGWNHQLVFHDQNSSGFGQNNHMAWKEPTTPPAVRDSGEVMKLCVFFLFDVFIMKTCFAKDFLLTSIRNNHYQYYCWWLKSCTTWDV